MLAHEGLDKNFRFMVLEVTRQLEYTFEILRNPSKSLIRKIRSSDHYVDTLKSLIEKKCISYFRHTSTLDNQSVDLARSLMTISSNLEKIADFCVDITGELNQMQDPTFMTRFDLARYQDEVFAALKNIRLSMQQRNATLAMDICRSEANLDSYYEQDCNVVKVQLREVEQVDDLITSLAIFHYLERMGDSLLNIGEAILFAITGEKLKFDRYIALEEALGTDEGELPERYHIDYKWETRSGSRIAKVQDKGTGTGQPEEAIFKEGDPQKLRREKDNIEKWDQLVPGLPARVIEYREINGDATLLLEFLEGYTFQELVLNAENALISKALGRILKVLDRIWRQTRRDQDINAGFLDQLLTRLEGVYRLHPAFRQETQSLGQVAIQSLDELIAEADSISARLSAPFSVQIHGDFNIDNIIYNHREDRVHFIDLYRSQRQDYVQDISVFMISNFRLPIFETTLRTRLDEIIQDFLAFSRGFAGEHDDLTFDARLTLALIRSLITSTRFELDEEFAKTMYKRAIYLLEKVIAHSGKSWHDFELPQDALIY